MMLMSGDALQAMAMAGERLSVLDGHPALLVDLDVGMTDTMHPAVLPWLRQLGCPVIGVGTAQAALSEAVDVRVGTVAEATRLAQGIAATPLAALVLVQVLRQIETLDLPAALFAESLAYSTLQAGPEHRRWLASRPASAPPPAVDSGPAVVLEADDAGCTLWLNRPSHRNAMSVEMRDALLTELERLLADPARPAVRIAGRGRCFSTGGELSEFGTAPDPATAHLVRSVALPGRRLAQMADRVTVMVHGACIGSGIEFPAFAGRVEARRDAWFQLPERAMGLIPGAGGCVSISRRIGRQHTAWWVLSGQRINAATALEWGLVDALIPQRI
ncbi:enoyl-CoA hydratase/isomerase family protein [Polycyclovorans algicola]|uniref:enoyl-CoA hydratase/isomerase family protein n=1 Tax=Polycyclovorans algicola TaxID=616992 RepID=UPI0004A7078C|nr:enoyl-CoA hydratase/isomerase family protein [Polycyclovorans algicola]